MIQLFTYNLKSKLSYEEESFFKFNPLHFMCPLQANQAVCLIFFLTIQLFDVFEERLLLLAHFRSGSPLMISPLVNESGLGARQLINYSLICPQYEVWGSFLLCRLHAF